MPAKVADIIGYYAGVLGGAPYPDFTLAGIDDNLPGGHSPPYFAILHQPLPTTPYLWSSDPVAFEYIYGDFFLAHEVAHQWWGQAIGWKNYHEQWLSEGMAQYFAALYAGRVQGEETLDRLIEQMRRSSAPFTNQGPISLGYRLGHIQSEGRVFRAIVYNKSAVVMHMLRRLIGDEPFFGALQDFYRDFRFRKAGALDLQRAFERRASRDLERFFDRWIRESALPDLDVDTRVDNDRGVGIVRVRQRGEVFDLPLRLEIEYEDRARGVVELTVSRDDEEFTVPLEGRARRIEVKDPLLP
jgi:aminopeptidase N